MSPRPRRVSRRAALGLGLALPFVTRASAAPLVIRDVNNRVVTLKAPAERIVLGFYYEEFTAIAGVAGWDRVVGFNRTAWADWRTAIFARYSKPIPRLTGLPDVGATDENTFSLEKVLALRPDLLILPDWSFAVLGEQVKQLDALGIPVLVTDYNAQVPERHMASTLAIGMATGNEARGQELAALYAGKVADIRRRIAGEASKPKVYLELGQGGAGVVGNSYGTGMWGRILDLVGAANIAAPFIPGAYAPINPEAVLAANPDAIFIAGSSWANRPNAVRTGFDASLATTRTSLAPYAQRPGWPQLTAIRDGQLFAIEHGLSRALFDYTAMQFIAKQIFPDRFADIDPVAELRRYHEAWLPVTFEGTWMARLAERGA
ncbi:MAG: ABC transporter substrate-binding protein [Proteobacteria bacterium]|nr:ABC transporter substrate-binding protein [Pseudomonadota bacterium]